RSGSQNFPTRRLKLPRVERALTVAVRRGCYPLCRESREKRAAGKGAQEHLARPITVWSHSGHW
ncbi:MAG: hypothetical protein KDD69_19680, partial [Bdellovibrionales bacterium]|nr:hypothetical protein [Bdellovibrionales bacterium]